MNGKLPLHLLTLSSVLLAASPAALAVEKGRVFDPDKRLRFNASIGELSQIDGFVQETTRRLFEVTGRPQPDNVEAYSFADFGLEKSNTTFGGSLEYLWKYVTLQFNGSWVRADAEGVASRDFFLGVKEVSFEGQDYEYQVILEGTPYHADLDAALIGLQANLTPVTFFSEGPVQLVPWVTLGLFGFTGQFDVHAGAALGLQEYENPPRQYVQNGQGQGEVTAFVPELGLGGEVKARVGSRKGRDAHLVFQGDYSIFQFRGSTSDLGISSRNEKDLDVDYNSLDGRLMFEWPWTSGTDLVVGAEYRVVSADALSEAQDRSLEETLQRREKFDKDISLEVTAVNVLFGVRW